jgi:hypothetical protein
VQFKAKHPELSDMSNRQICEYYINIKDESLSKLCNEYGVKLTTVKSYKKRHPEMTNRQIVELYSNKVYTEYFSDTCRRYNIPEDKISTVMAYRNKHKEIESDEKVIMEWIKLQSEESFSDSCRQLSIEPRIALKYRSKHPELSDEQIINYYLSKRQGLALKYRSKHPELSDEQIINYYLSKRESFTSLCNKFEIDYSNAENYRWKHPELSDEQVIIHYRPDLIINIFGEIVEYKE